MDIKLIDFEIKGDNRGSLIAIESNINIPFEIKRIYYIYGTKKNIRRGFHAHKKLRQIAVCIHGSCKMLLDDGEVKKTVLLNKPNKGLLINEMIWREMYDFSENCVLLVLASDYYYEEDYIRDYNNYINEIVK